MVQPHGVADYLGGEPMAIVRVGRRLHAASLVHLRAGDQSRLP
jgi:hypothetical protein